MKKAVCTALILMATSSLSYGKCKLTAGAVPDVPDATSASLQQMLTARQEVKTYMEASRDFVMCAQGRGDRRTDRVMKKMHRLSKKFNIANKTFSERVAKDPSILSNPEQMVAQN